MLKRWVVWLRGIRWLAGIAAVVLAAAIVWALFVPLADWLVHHDVGSATGALHETALDNARGRLLTLGAGLVAGGALVFTALNFNLLRRNSVQADRWQRRTHELTEQGQVTDRFTKAIEQLGSDQPDVRIGGIYALERIARDSDKDHPTVMEVLTAFIREHSREPWPVDSDGAQHGEKKTRRDVQAAVTVVGRRDAEHDIRVIDLIGADLANADLSGVDLARVDLTRATLTRATLSGADLTRAILIRATLSGADLTGADLTDARPIDADLTGADLTGANLTYANLTRADLTRADLRANLTGADLIHADLTRADLSGARLAYADLTGATLTGAHLTHADLTDARWPTAGPVPEGWTPDGESGRLKPAGQLSEVTAHYL